MTKQIDYTHGFKVGDLILITINDNAHNGIYEITEVERRYRIKHKEYNAIIHSIPVAVWDDLDVRSYKEAIKSGWSWMAQHISCDVAWCKKFSMSDFYLEKLRKILDYVDKIDEIIKTHTDKIQGDQI